MAIMFPFSQAELERRAALEASGQVEPKRRREWARRGAFKTRPLTPRETRLRCERTRDWLWVALRKPAAAAELLRRARAEGIPRCGLYRAKKHYKIVSVRIGGIARAGRWVWKLPDNAASL